MSIKNILNSIPNHISDKILTVPQRLASLGNLYTSRGSTYKDSYLTFGNIINEVFPNGLILKNSEDFNRYHLITTILNKTVRYCQNFENGGHVDSINDISVYAQMLNKFDEISYFSKTSVKNIEQMGQDDFINAINQKEEIIQQSMETLNEKDSIISELHDRLLQYEQNQELNLEQQNPPKTPQKLRNR